ncbi:MAG: GGDEF domain-containing protein [Eubacteriales bacterium]
MLEKYNLRKITINILAFMGMICLLFDNPMTVQAESNQTVRVAFLPDMYGFFMLEENGGYSGYNYDYLMTVAQYTGWNLEFVEVSEGSSSASLKKAGEMLEAGELDLVGPFSVSTPNLDDYEIGEKNYGVYRYNIYSARDNYAITEYNYFLKDTISIALVEAYTDLNQKFFDIVENKGMDFQVTYVQTHAESLELLFDEKVDTILNLDMSVNALNLDFVTVVDHLPFYFASTKGNTELIDELDAAIEKIEIISPYYHDSLLNTYFGLRYEGDFVFTDEEKIQMAQQGSFKVGVVKSIPPFIYTDSEGNTVGIMLEVLDKLTEIMGIPFEVVYYDTVEEMLESVEKHEIDLLGNMSAEYDLAHERNVTLTNSYISSGVYWLRNQNEAADPDILYHYVSSNIPFYKDEELIRMVEIEPDMKKMASDGTVSIFCNPYVAEYFINSLRLDNIEVQTVSNVKSEIAFGVLNHVDKSLIGMLNRGILYLDDGEMDEIIFRNTVVQGEYSLEDVISDYYFEILLLISAIALGIIYVVHRSAQKFKELSRRDGLTHLYNAGYFHDYATNKIPTLKAGTLIILDIDYFKKVNDNHGHHKGDEIIIKVAEVLKKHFKTEDVVARLGGDEFVVLLEHATTVYDLEKRCKEILDELSNAENQVPVTLSIGGYSFTNTNTYNELYKKADDELYKVKEKGRNGFLFHEQ